MTDDADKADVYIEQMLKAALDRIKPEIKGELGECDMCSEVGRLIEGICVPCVRLQEARDRNWRV